MRPRPRYLLDTEVLVRAFRSDGPARELLGRGMLRDLSLLTSVEILDELEEVLARPKFGLTRSELRAVRHVVLRAADTVVLMDEEDIARWVPSDPGDDHVAEAAARSGADVLVTSDAHFEEIEDPPFAIETAGEACHKYRGGVPYGVARLMTSEERAEQAKALAGPGRAGADRVVRELTARLDYEEYDEGVRAAVLTPVEAAELGAELVSACGARLALDLRHTGSFDFLSGTRHDVPQADAPVALDLVWYSSDRAQAEAIEGPEAPTVADLGFSDDIRCRCVLAGGIVLVLDVEGPEGEPDVRVFVPADEPLAETPAVRTEYRVSDTHAGRVTVRSRDPAGFTSSVTAWLLGGPSALLSGSNLSPDTVIVSFLLADRVARANGLPVPPPDALEPLVPPGYHDRIVRT